MYVGVLDIGGTKTIAAIVDETGAILQKDLFPTHTANAELHLEQCAVRLKALLQKEGISERDLCGVGVTLPGIVNSQDGVLIYAPYAQWENISVASFLAKELGGRKIYCENDVNACAIGEQFFGIGKQYMDYVWVTVSTGVGGAVVSGGELLRGGCGFAGELGHLKVEYDHPERCPCGQYGCLEAQASGTAINREIKRMCAQDPEFYQAFLDAGERPDGAGCAKLARAGNQTAARIYEKAGKYLGRGFSYCANILNPQAIIVGGGVSASLDLMLSGIKTAIQKYTFSQHQGFEVVQTALGYEAALYGAAALVLREQ